MTELETIFTRYCDLIESSSLYQCRFPYFCVHGSKVQNKKINLSLSNTYKHSGKEFITYD